jgi:hypothetical protein
LELAVQNLASVVGFNKDKMCTENSVLLKNKINSNNNNNSINNTFKEHSAKICTYDNVHFAVEF